MTWSPGWGPSLGEDDDGEARGIRMSREVEWTVKCPHLCFGFTNEPWWQAITWWRLGDKQMGILYVSPLKICCSSKTSTKSNSCPQSSAGICGTREVPSQCGSDGLHLGLCTLTIGWHSGCGLCDYDRFLCPLPCPGSDKSNCFIRLWWSSKVY